METLRTGNHCQARVRGGGVHPTVETPVHDNIRELVTRECKEHGVNIMNVFANPKRK